VFPMKVQIALILKAVVEIVLTQNEASKQTKLL
jgi:hypothetical protein